MKNKLISVSLTVKDKMACSPNWVSACSLFLMIGLLVMCRPHAEVARSLSPKPRLDLFTPYPVSVRLDSSYALRLSPIYSFHLPSQEYNSPLLENENWRTRVVSYALKYLGRPYRSAGKSPSGFDCSGFTGFVFANFGYKLPAHSGSQAMVGKKISIKEAQKGDLAFFGWRTKKGVLVNHAAIVTSDPGKPLKIVHSASGKGIVVTYINQSEYWKRMLLFVRRVEINRSDKS